jgi:hypothetical protein
MNYKHLRETKEFSWHNELFSAMFIHHTESLFKKPAKKYKNKKIMEKVALVLLKCPEK